MTARTINRALLQLLGSRRGPGLGKQLQRKRRFSQALALQISLSGDSELAYTTETDWLSQQIAGGAIVQPSTEAGPC